uniref:Uncharacterized protein n=1 Tax=Glossina pallidipes TaxID=7398 RepID=A0A1A9ZI08_GLOPL
MFDTIVYIPTILAYAFISLLVLILGFIVMYVSHKVYAYIYDSLPVAQFSESSILSANKLNRISAVITKSECQIGRKSKTALRIYVNIEPCYLAYVVFETDHNHGTNSGNENREIQSNFDLLNEGRCMRLIKYFDSLTAIPIGPSMRKCKYPLDNYPSISDYTHRNK